MGSDLPAALTFSVHRQDVGLLLWAHDDRRIPGLVRRPFILGQRRDSVRLVSPEGDELGDTEVAGWWLPASDAAQSLATLPMAVVHKMPASVAVWSLASKWVVEALARQQLVPALVPGGDDDAWCAQWKVAAVHPDDRARLSGLADAMPGVARASLLDDGERVPTAIRALKMFMDSAVDGLLRSSTPERAVRPGQGPDWTMRLGRALAGPDASFGPLGLMERRLPEALDEWTSPATSMGGRGRPLVGFQLEEPKRASGVWRISFHLLEPSTESRVPVDQLQSTDPAVRELIERMAQPEQTLLQALDRCARVCPPLDRAISSTLTSGLDIDGAEAWDFLTRSADQLQRAGYWVSVPAELSRVGRRRVRPRMRVGIEPSGLNSGLLDGMVAYRWEASLGDDTLTAAEFRRLVNQNVPLIRHRGSWVAIDPEEVARLKRLMDGKLGELNMAEALRLALSGTSSVPGAPDDIADVVADGVVASAVDVLTGNHEASELDLTPPDGLEATLRPYQQRGLAWLRSVTNLNLGACLADDMGLGKTIQVIALCLDLVERRKGRHFLVICPNSVLGNWRREIERFAPGLRVVMHHGPGRSGGVMALRKLLPRDREGTVVITSYALARRDVKMLERLHFDLLILDEAQNVKNPEAAQTQAISRLRARCRVALTGTPMENRLMELWSLMEVLNTSLLGTRTHFRRRFALPVERNGDEEAAECLRRIISPFLLRRMKSDPTVAPDLPDKVELVRYCALSPEQASLYQGVLEESLSGLAGMDYGMARRGKVLALLTALKQICNHPAHYLKDSDIRPERSGKMQRFLGLLNTVLDADSRPLVFTQYREMGEILREVISDRLGVPVPFYHGGLAREVREQLVHRFQNEAGVPLMIVSLRAGGTGLNLTRAHHVFHYDRWWNPAVEDQATDRAFRIGQTRDVTVHRMVSQGTLEEQIHRLLGRKRSLANQVVVAGETWLTDVDDATLRDLASLGHDAVMEDEQ